MGKENNLKYYFHYFSHSLSERVDKMENSIGNIVSKIDAVLNKMAAMDRAKTKRRENMNKILNTISEVSTNNHLFCQNL